MRNQSVYSLEGSNQGSLKADATRRERDVLRKGIERMQKQIYHLISVQISQEFCNEVENLMDKAQDWCLNIKDLYNKTEVHSINTSKGDAANVGIFLDNSQSTAFKFLEAAELAYLGWGNSV